MLNHFRKEGWGEGGGGEGGGERGGEGEGELSETDST